MKKETDISMFDIPPMGAQEYIDECKRLIEECKKMKPVSVSSTKQAPIYDVHRYYSVIVEKDIDYQLAFDNRTSELLPSWGAGPENNVDYLEYRKWAEYHGLTFQDGQHTYVLEGSWVKSCGNLLNNGVYAYNLIMRFIEITHRSRCVHSVYKN